MLKRPFFLLTLTIFIGINAAQPPADAATKKINDILSKMGVLNTSLSGSYTEVSLDAQYINTYDANHECTDSQPISACMRQILNKQDANNEEQEEITLYLYRLATRLEIQQEPSRKLKPTMIKKLMQFNKFIIPRIIVMNFLPKIVSTCIPEQAGYKKITMDLLTGLISANLMDFGFKNIIYYEKQDEAELNKQTSYNLGFHTDGNYPSLFKQNKYSTSQKAFDEGRKARENQSHNS